jgi:hypothetical protein
MPVRLPILAATALIVAVLLLGVGSPDRAAGATASADLVVKTGTIPCPPSSTANYCVPAGGALLLSTVLTNVPQFGYYGFYSHIDYGSLGYKPTVGLYDEILWPDLISAGRTPADPLGTEGSVEHGATSVTDPLGPPSSYAGPLVELTLNCTSEGSSNAIRLLPDLSSVTIMVGPYPVAQHIALSDAITIDCVGPPPVPPTPGSVGGISFEPPTAGLRASGTSDTTTIALAFSGGVAAFTAAMWYARRRLR